MQVCCQCAFPRKDSKSFRLLDPRRQKEVAFLTKNEEILYLSYYASRWCRWWHTLRFGAIMSMCSELNQFLIDWHDLQSCFDPRDSNRSLWGRDVLLRDLKILWSLSHSWSGAVVISAGFYGFYFPDGVVLLFPNMNFWVEELIIGFSKIMCLKGKRFSFQSSSTSMSSLSNRHVIWRAFLTLEKEIMQSINCVFLITSRFSPMIAPSAKNNDCVESQCIKNQDKSHEGLELQTHSRSSPSQKRFHR